MTARDGTGLREWLERVRGEYWERLGQPPEPAVAPGPARVLFWLCGRRLALEATLCKGVVRRPRAARLPGLPPWLLGVAGIRGEVVSLTDPAAYLGMRGARPPGAGFVLLLAAGPLKAGLWVDRVADVVAVPEPEVLPVESPWPGCPPGAFEGHWPAGDPPVLLLDGRRYLEQTAVGEAGPR